MATITGTLLLEDNMGDNYTTTDATNLFGWTSAPSSLQTGLVSGGQCFRMANNNVDHPLAAGTEFTLHYRFRYSVLPAGRDLLIWLEGSTIHATLRLQADGSVILTRNGTTIGTTVLAAGSIAANTVYHLGWYIKIDDTTGASKVWLNKQRGDSPDNSQTGLDTRNGGTGQVNGIRLNPGSGANHDADDLHIWSGDDFKGDTRVIGQVANSAGNYAQWTPLSSTNISNVNQTTQDGDTTYNSDATSGHRDSFGFPSLGVGSGSDVIAVVPYVIARKDDAGARNIGVMTRRGGTDYDGASQALSTTYAKYREAWLNDPSTGPAQWTVSGVDAGEYGYKDV